MSAIDRQGLERAAKVAQVIAEHPDLPMMCLAPSTPSDYSSYYHDVYGASVQRILFPLEVEKLYGDTYFWTSSPTRRGVSDMNDIYAEVHRRQYERYLRREAQRQWEAERPKRILGYLITGVQLVIVSIIFYALLFAGALWASM